MSLEETFDEAMLSIYRQAKKECNYKASAFLDMVVTMGGVATAKKLLSSDRLQSGLYELWRCDRLDLTVEDHVLRPEFRGLFEPEELAEAQRRLDLLTATSG